MDKITLLYAVLLKIKNADYKLSIFKDLPIKHKRIAAQPLLEKINIKNILKQSNLYWLVGNLI